VPMVTLIGLSHTNDFHLREEHPNRAEISRTTTTAFQKVRA